jgi:hypothetical protein
LQTKRKHFRYWAIAAVIGQLEGARAERARQFFDCCVVTQVVVHDPASLENEIDNCAKRIKAESVA